MPRASAPPRMDLRPPQTGADCLAGMNGAAFWDRGCPAWNSNGGVVPGMGRRQQTAGSLPQEWKWLPPVVSLGLVPDAAVGPPVLSVGALVRHSHPTVTTFSL